MYSIILNDIERWVPWNNKKYTYQMRNGDEECVRVCVYESLKEPLYHTSSSTHTYAHFSLFPFRQGHLCRVFAGEQSKIFKDKLVPMETFQIV